MSLLDDDPLLSKLRELPAPELDPAVRERTRRLARQAFAGVARPPSRLAVASRVLLAAALALSAAVYVTGAVGALGRIYVASAP